MEGEYKRTTKKKSYKRLGKLNKVNMLYGLYGFSADLLMGVLKMSILEMEILLAGVRKDIENPQIHAYIPIPAFITLVVAHGKYSVVVYGQKPCTPSD